jgi:hypothetical protein
MALKPCRECGEQVSSRADYCRHCGRWMVWGRLDELSGVPLLLLLLMYYFNDLYP